MVMENLLELFHRKVGFFCSMQNDCACVNDWKWCNIFFLFRIAEVPLEKLERFKRQDLDEDALEKQLCSDKGAGEWFRLETGEDKCRDVIQCTSSVSYEYIIKMGTCPLFRGPSILCLISKNHIGTYYLNYSSIK